MALLSRRVIRGHEGRVGRKLQIGDTIKFTMEGKVTLVSILAEDPAEALMWETPDDDKRIVAIKEVLGAVDTFAIAEVLSQAAGFRGRFEIGEKNNIRCYRLLS